MVCDGMYRPQPAFVKKGKERKLSRDYKAYLSNLIGMTADERRERKDLGVHLTQKKEKDLVGFFCAVDFLEQPCNGNGDS